MQTLSSTKEVVLLLGGTARVAELIKRSAANVSMWLNSGRIPARWVEVIRLACYRRGYWVESSVFGLPDIDYPSVPQITLGPSSPAMASSGEGVLPDASSSLDLAGASALAPFRGG